MHNSLETILRNFYAAVLPPNVQNSQKKEALDRYFSRFHNFQEVRTDVLKQNKEVEYETLASIEDMDPSSFTSPKRHFISSSMLFTFLHANQSTSSDSYQPNHSKVVSQAPFTDYSFSKVLLYAILVNYAHLNKHSHNQQHNNDLGHCLELAEQTLKKVKVALVSAAQSFKLTNKKKYAKIRYLYEQLINYVEKMGACREDYIRVIIEELEDDFIHKTLHNLKSKCSELVYSQSICSSMSLDDSALREDGEFLEMERALEYLRVRVVLQREEGVVELGSEQELNVVVEEMPNRAYKLKEVISMHGSDHSFAQ